MITVIIPFFNAEKYLSTAVRSVIKQTFQDWEIILVDDCSLDSSKKIAEKMCADDKRIHYTCNDINLGVDRSRFVGLNKSRGEFIMFLDADDWLAKNALELLYKKIEQENADIVTGSFIRVLDRFALIKSKPINTYLGIRTESIIQPKLFDDYFLSYFGINKLLISVWGKIYRKSTLELAAISPTGMKMGEDLLFNMFLHPHLHKIAFVGETVYYYRFGGMTTTSNPNFLENIKKQYFLKKEFCNKYSYKKAIDPLNHEMVNCFFSHYENLILLDDYAQPDLSILIEKELKEAIYDHLVVNRPFERYTVLKSKDVKIITDFIVHSSKMRRHKFKLKKVISKLLN